MAGINSMHDLLRTQNGSISFGTQANPAMVTLGPTDGGEPSWPAYETKHSLNIKMPKETPILAPLDLRFVGFKNRSAEYRQDTPEDSYQAPYDDLALCFESVSDDWPGLVMCVYHLYTTPLLQAHLDNDACGIQERWDGGGAESGRIYYEYNSTEVSLRDPESCQPLLGSIIDRGGVIGYSGQVGDNPHSGFKFKVRSLDQNPLTTACARSLGCGDPYLHWVQPSVFFYWQCFEPDAVFQPGVLAYPFDCEATTTTPLEQQSPTTTAAPLEQQLPATTPLPESVFKPSLEERYEVNIEEAVVYGTGGTLDGGQVDLLLDLAVPDTGTDGPRPLWVDIHGGGFTEGSRNPQWGPAARGWVAASIDYRLAGDDPLPGPRFQGFYEAIGGAESPARYRSVVAAVEDTLTAVDYLVGRADELVIDTDRIVLAGFSAGAFTALNAAYCTDKFGITRPPIAAVVDYGGRLIDTCGAGSSIDPGEAAVFVAHGTEDTGETRFEGALSIIEGAQEAGIAYEFHPLDGVAHTFAPHTATIADGRTVEAATYEFLDRVLYSEYAPTTTEAPTTTDQAVLPDRGHGDRTHQIWPEVWSQHGPGVQSWEYKVNCNEGSGSGMECFLSDLTSVAVTTPTGEKIELEKDFNINDFSGEVTRRWVRYGPKSGSLPEPGDYTFSYWRGSELVYKQSVPYDSEVISYPTGVEWSRSGQNIVVDWIPPPEASNGMFYKVLVWPVLNPPDVPISQVFDWDATSGVLQEVPLLEDTSYRLNVAIYFSDGYAYSDDVIFEWPAPKPSGFPRVCQAWAGIQNRPDLSELEQFASHDLMWSGLWDLGLAWRVSGDQPHQGLSTTLMDIWGNPDAAEERKASLLQLNPDFKFLVSVLYREGKYVDDESGFVSLRSFGHFPPDSPFWIRDAVGEPVPAFGNDNNLDGVIELEEIDTALLDFRNPDLIELVAQKALALEQTGVVDGVFLDWWAEHNRTAASYIDWSTFYMTAEEEIEARLAILRRIRELVSDDFLILGNTNQLTAPRSAPYMNGMYMEAVKADRFGGYTVSELETIEESLYWGSENLKEPRINCLEGWRVVHDYGEDDDDALIAERDSAENKQWMRLITTLTLTHSDGHVLFAGNPISSHAHNWYDFWDADLGQPVGDKRQLLDGVEGLFIREFTNGYAVYNRSGTSQTISLSNDVTAVSTGLVADTHQLGDLDGEIYLGPTSGTPAG